MNFKSIIKHGFKGYFSIFLLLQLFSFSSCEDEPKNKVIGLQTLNYFPDFYLDSISAAIHRCYGYDTYVMPNIKIPDSHFIKVKSPRYRADSIINMLNERKPDSLAHILGLTCVDISVTKRDKLGRILKPVAFYTDWGVFGYGYVGKPGSVVSTFRVQGPNQKLVIDRMQKISLHELGHNMGLPHCPNKNCFMRDAVESIKTVDKEGKTLCSDCKKKLR